MSARRPTESAPDAPVAPEPAPPVARPATLIGAVTDAARTRRREPGPLSLEDAEERYVAARDAWTAAMRKANSGRSADLASLAITQEAYELAVVEVERWRSGAKAAIPIDHGPNPAHLEAAIGQEMAWRRVHADMEKQPGRLVRILRRLARRE